MKRPDANEFRASINDFLLSISRDKKIYFYAMTACCRTGVSLFLFAAIHLLPCRSAAQCVIDSSQTSSGVYPDTLPDATAGQFYTSDITFVMITDTGGLTISNFEILNVTGVPIGLTWQCNNFANG